MAQQHCHGVHVAGGGQHLASEAAPSAVAGAFDTCLLVQGRDVALRTVACLVVVPLATFKRAPLCVLDGRTWQATGKEKGTAIRR